MILRPAAARQRGCSIVARRRGVFALAFSLLPTRAALAGALVAAGILIARGLARGTAALARSGAAPTASARAAAARACFAGAAGLDLLLGLGPRRICCRDRLAALDALGSTADRLRARLLLGCRSAVPALLLTPALA